jgi:hypothetical protein
LLDARHPDPCEDGILHGHRLNGEG